MSRTTSPADNQPAKPYPGIKRVLIYWLFLGILGAILGIFAAYIIGLDHFIQWETFAAAPPGAQTVVSGDLYKAVMRTSSGEILSCNPVQHECWIADTLSPQTIAEPCIPNSAPFNPLAHAPRNWVSCRAFQGYFVEGKYTVLYLLDDQGNLWRWRKTASGLGAFAAISMAVIGALIGLLVGSYIWIGQRLSYIRRNLHEKQHP